jgi:hypothetical protein
MKGKYQMDGANPKPIEGLPEWNELRQQEVSRIPYWWSVKGREQFVWATAGIRWFLGITESGFAPLNWRKRRTDHMKNATLDCWTKTVTP